MSIYKAHSRENGAIFNLIFINHTTTKNDCQFVYKEHYLKVTNHI